MLYISRIQVEIHILFKAYNYLSEFNLYSNFSFLMRITGFIILYHLNVTSTKQYHGAGVELIYTPSPETAP